MTISLDRLEPATATIACLEQTHTIRWVAGELLALDHGDAEGELALAALGQTSVPCLTVLAAWRRHRHDHRLLSAVTRGSGDWVSAEPDQPHPGLSAVGARGTPISPVYRPAGGPARRFPGSRVIGFPGSRVIADLAPGDVSDHDQITALARLGGSIPRRLVATVTASLLEQSESRAGPALVASLFGRAGNGLSGWLGDPDLQVDLEVIDPSDTPQLEAGDRGAIRVALPLTWVAEVWGRGVSVLAERFTLAVVPTTDHHLVLDTVGLDLRDRRQIEVARTAPSQ